MAAVYGAQFCYHEIPDKLDLFDAAAFAASPMEFHVVCTDILTGEPVYRKNIVVLTQPEGYVKTKNSLLWLMKLKYRKYPKLIEAVATRHERYNAATAYVFGQEKNGACPLVTCKPLQNSKQFKRNNLENFSTHIVKSYK